MREPVMLRDDEGGGVRPITRNVLGERLEVCSLKPMTGFFRDGCCDTSRDDVGSHTICAVMTEGFLVFSKARGNDLSTPAPEFGFRACSPAIAGACARLAGKRHSRAAKRRAWCCGPPTKARLPIARSPTSSVSPWISIEEDDASLRD